MELSEFDFDLPEELIALRPVRPRRASRLLVAESAALHDSVAADLGRWLRPGDLLVFNDTRVIPARLEGARMRSDLPPQPVEITLIRAETETRWKALARPARRLAAGDRIVFGSVLVADVRAREGGAVVLDLSAVSGSDSVGDALASVGRMPLPPYIAARRKADASDDTDYQTVFAARPGAVAAPTAALHFDAELLADLEARGVARTTVTLHVGAGTFLPVKVERIEDHRMHSEWGEIGAETVDAVHAARARGGRVIPVGTTALRVLETAGAQGDLAPWSGETDIFIRPGYRFGVADGLMTNFHLPRSTLMMLVAAMMGLDRIREIYAHAIAERYRFFSYGDASLLLPTR